MRPLTGLLGSLITLSQVALCPLLHSSSLEKASSALEKPRDSPRPLVERANPDPLSKDLLYTYNQSSGVFIFRVGSSNGPLPDFIITAEGKPNKDDKYGSMKDFAASLDSLMQIINKEHPFLDYLKINLAHIDEVAERIREAAARSPEWKNRKPLKHPDVASYGDLVGKIILQDHVLREVEAVLRKNGFRMSNIGMENLGLTKSLDTGEELPELLSCAEISIEPLDK